MLNSVRKKIKMRHRLAMTTAIVGGLSSIAAGRAGDYEACVAILVVTLAIALITDDNQAWSNIEEINDNIQ